MLEELSKSGSRINGKRSACNYQKVALLDRLDRVVNVLVPEENWDDVTASGTVTSDATGTNVWTQATAPVEGEDARFYRVRAILPAN